jgi:hypothetical protein
MRIHNPSFLFVVLAMAVLGSGGRCLSEAPRSENTIASDTFDDGDFTANPTWAETKTDAFSINTVEGASVAELKAGMCASLSLKIDKLPERFTVKVRFRYPVAGADFSKVWIGLSADGPEKGYSVRLCDTSGFGGENDIVIFKDGVAQSLALGNTNLLTDNNWHTLTLAYDGVDQRLDAFFDESSTPILSVQDATYSQFTGIYIGGESCSAKPIQFGEILVEK